MVDSNYRINTSVGMESILLSGSTSVLYFDRLLKSSTKIRIKFAFILPVEWKYNSDRRQERYSFQGDNHGIKG